MSRRRIEKSDLSLSAEDFARKFLGDGYVAVFKRIDDSIHPEVLKEVLRKLYELKVDCRPFYEFPLQKQLDLIKTKVPRKDYPLFDRILFDALHGYDYSEKTLGEFHVRVRKRYFERMKEAVWYAEDFLFSEEDKERLNNYKYELSEYK